MKKEELMNKVVLKGKVSGNVKRKYERYGERFYEMNIKVKRLSGIYDTIPILISEFVLGKERLGTNLRGKIVKVIGNLNVCYKEKEDKGVYRDLFVYVHNIIFYEKEQEKKNFTYLRGTVHKEPVLRRSYLQNIPVTYLLISVPNGENEVDLIPCIAWYKNSIKAKEFKIGEQVKVYGVVQSHKISKRMSNSDEIMSRTIREVSVVHIYKE